MPRTADWTSDENDEIVADYFVMLADDLAGRAYSKATHNRALQERIGRPRGAIEYKHQNISAVLMCLGEPWISGYKPAFNFQASLVDAVLRWLDRHPNWILSQALGRRPSGYGQAVREAPLWIGPPPTFSNAPPPVDIDRAMPIAGRFDPADRDARNRALGRAGEERVLIHERASLSSQGREDLAKRVRWTSEEEGDSAGFDIASFQPDGRSRLIEVKTTNGWERTPFHITRNELAVAEARRDEWHLVRLYDFARGGRAFELRPPLEAHVALTPTSFMATPI